MGQNKHHRQTHISYEWIGKVKFETNKCRRNYPATKEQLRQYLTKMKKKLDFDLKSKHILQKNQDSDL